jgi:tripartite-type tricarboxylate transporter receptor subunit TctC
MSAISMGYRQTVIGTGLVCTVLAPAFAQVPAEFYKDKTVTVVMGSSVGGGLDTYGRLFARHLAKHIPGNPRVLPQNMPGAGSVAAASYIYTNAAKDGTAVGIVLAGAIIEPLLSSGARRYEPTRFQYIVNANLETLVCLVRSDAPVKSFEDVFKTELIVGGTGPGSTLSDYPVFMKNFFGAKLKLVQGYPGSREVSLAVQKGELHGVCGINWTSALLQYPDLLKEGGPFRVILQEDLKGSAELNKLGVPLVTKFSRNDEDRQVIDVFYIQGALNRVFIAPPETPADRVAVLRKAFLDALADPELQAEAGKMRADTVATPGAEVQATVAQLFATPPGIVERLKKAMEGIK